MIKIQKPKICDTTDISTLFVAGDGRHQRNNLFYQYSNRSPFGGSISAVAKDAGRIVGHYSILPLRFLHGSKPLKAGYAQQAIIHPAFRNLKNIALLHDFVVKKAMKRFDFLFAFSNDNFAQVKKQILGWSDLGSFESDVIEVDSLDFAQNHKVVRLDSFACSFKPDFFGIEKTKSYLNYRFFEHMVNHYIVFGVLSKNRLLGYIALKLHKRDTELVGHFIDYEAQDENVFCSLVMEVKKYFKFYGVKNIIFWNRGDFKGLLEGFVVKRDFKTNFLIYNPKNIEVVSKKENWNLSMLYSDAF